MLELGRRRYGFKDVGGRSFVELVDVSREGHLQQGVITGDGISELRLSAVVRYLQVHGFKILDFERFAVRLPFLVVAKLVGDLLSPLFLFLWGKRRAVIPPR